MNYEPRFNVFSNVNPSSPQDALVAGVQMNLPLALVAIVVRLVRTVDWHIHVFRLVCG